MPDWPTAVDRKITLHLKQVYLEEFKNSVMSQKTLSEVT
jgi:hypothetical protein